MAAYGLARRMLGQDAKRLEYGWLRTDYRAPMARRFHKKLCHRIVRRIERETLHRIDQGVAA